MITLVSHQQTIGSFARTLRTLAPTILQTRRASRPLIVKPQNSQMSSAIKAVHTEKSYPPVGHYSQAFAANGQVWVAGQVALDLAGNLVKGSVTDQAHQICKNIDAILKAAGSSAEKTVKVTCYITDFSKLPEFNEVYNSYFPQKPPRTSVEVSRLPLDVLIEPFIATASIEGNGAKTGIGVLLLNR